MRHLLDLIYEAQWLRASASDLALPLEPGEGVRLLGLETLLRGEPSDADDRRRTLRMPYPADVELTERGGFAFGEVVDIGGGGLRVALRAPLKPVAGRVLVRLVVEHGAGRVEYVFPCVLAWSADGHCGLRFHGVPRRERVRGEEDDTGVRRRESVDAEGRRAAG
jgi:hypothetical protein